MQLWTLVWSVLLLGSLGLFAVLAVVIGIGGFRDLRELLSRPPDQADD